MRGVNDCAVRGITKSVPDSRNVGAAPLAHSECLRHLLGNEVSEYRKLAIEVVIDARNFLGEVGGRIIAADKGGIPIGVDRIRSRENTGAD